MLCTVLAVLLVTGCDWVSKSPPDTGTVRVEDTTDEREVTVVISTNFGTTRDQSGSLRLGRVFEADTLTVTPPFERQYDLRITRRLFARVLLPETDKSGLQLQGTIGGEPRFTTLSSEADSTLEFFYIFGSANPAPGETL